MKNKIQASYWIDKDLHKLLTYHCKKQSISKSILISELFKKLLTVHENRSII